MSQVPATDASADESVVSADEGATPDDEAIEQKQEDPWYVPLISLDVGGSMMVDPEQVSSTQVAKDLSSEEDKGDDWFVAPVPFQSPVLGWGLAAVGGYIFRMGDDPDTPASMVAAGGLYSQNDSFGGILGAKLHLPGDDWRVLSGAGAGTGNYDFYGIGNDA